MLQPIKSVLMGRETDLKNLGANSSTKKFHKGIEVSLNKNVGRAFVGLWGEEFTEKDGHGG